MSESNDMVINSDRSGHARSGSPGVLAMGGQWIIGQGLELIRFAGTAGAVIWQSWRPLTWRRTVRAEFFHQCHQVGTRALPFIIVTGIIIGLGMVYQALYWLQVFGQTGFAGRFLVLVLVREIAPLLVGLIIIGRSGSVIMVELGNMQIGGQVRMLDSQGIDPFLFLVVPRAVAVSVCMFSLTMIFLAVALGAGFAMSSALRAADLTLYDFIFGILSAMEIKEFAILPLKTLIIGFVVALIACTTGLAVSGSRADLVEAMPRGIVKSVLATLLLSSGLTLLLL